MHSIAFASLFLSLLVTLSLSFKGCFDLSRNRNAVLVWMERGQLACTGFLLLSSWILTLALVNRDFSFLYVQEYTDTFLPTFYAVTAFWAGQDGSFLFWALMLALLGAIMIFTPGYRLMDQKTKIWFWLFFFLVQGFFLLLLTSVSNPFVQLINPPDQGNGMNPLLQNPGMIFHPPLLFIGYAGFTIPCCLAFAHCVTGSPFLWLERCRNWLIMAWIFLTAGIVLGAWWSYMELGWGGYWAWDPVENASLIPWFAATALLHTALIGRTRKGLLKTNIFLASLTLLLCFYGTFIVRSGFIESLHAFGSGGVGMPLIVFMMLGLMVTLAVLYGCRQCESRQLDGMFSKPGILLLVVWLLLALGGIVFLGVNWPVISGLWSENTVGFGPDFYNRVCLPPMSLIVLLLGFCPWLAWKSGAKSRLGLWFTLGALVLGGGGLYLAGLIKPLSLFAGSSAVAVLVSIPALFLVNRSLTRQLWAWGAYGVHVGVALIALGIAFSGPYQINQERIVQKGGVLTVGEYEILYTDFEIKPSPGMTAYEARLMVAKNGRPLGTLTPQKRMYANFEQPFAEVSIIPSLGDEIYATLLGFDEDKNISVKITINPLVNWLWIGGTLMCVMAFFCLRRQRKSGRSSRVASEG
ncbi:heme lyase CcmF/NrfE family subunit [Desulfoplanes sp. PS50]